MTPNPDLPPPVPPDDKDWTWVLDRPCPQCGWDALDVPHDQIAARIRATGRAWSGQLSRPDVRVRPTPTTWSPLEYACHVRDVNHLFAQRLGLMLAQDCPTFASWDQDATAIESRYDLADPATVAIEVRESAEMAADEYDTVTGQAWARRGIRSNGSAFTVASLGRYHLHDIVHHLWDVSGAPAAGVPAEPLG